MGFFRPLPLDDSRLIVLRYAAKGFVPTLIEAKPTEDLSAVTFLGAQVAAQYPEVKGWVAATPSDHPVRVPGRRARVAYRPERNLSLESLIPVVEGFQDSVGTWRSARFSDPLGLDWLALDTSYSPDDALPSRERLHFAPTAHHGDWTTGAAWNGADFYDLFGPTKRSLRRLQRLRRLRSPLHLRSAARPLDFIAKVAYYGDLDTLPGFQNVVSPTKNLFTAEAGLVSVGHACLPGRGGCRDRPQLVAQGARLRGRRRLLSPSQRHIRRRLPAAARPFLDLAAQRCELSRTERAATRSPTLYLGGFGNN